MHSELFGQHLVQRTGQLFLTRDARELFVVHLEGDGLTVNADNLLAFDASLSCAGPPPLPR